MNRFARYALSLIALTGTAIAADDPPGLWATLRNECPGAAAANVSDRICGVTIGTASFTRTVQSGEVAPGFEARITLCTDKSGQGVLQFSPLKATTAPFFVTVKPDGTAVYPKAFCKK